MKETKYTNFRTPAQAQAYINGLPQGQVILKGHNEYNAIVIVEVEGKLRKKKDAQRHFLEEELQQMKAKLSNLERVNGPEAQGMGILIDQAKQTIEMLTSILITIQKS